MVLKRWPLYEAKNKFSELVDRALKHGPQLVTRRGEEVVVVISKEEYRRLRSSEPSLKEFFRSSPLVGQELDLERDKSLPRDVEL